MSAEKRNVWIILTMIALLITGLSAIKKLRHRGDVQEMRIERLSQSTCGKWKQNEMRESRDSRQERHPLIERKRRHCRTAPHAGDFYLPDQLPVPQNYDVVRNEVRERHAGRGGTLVVRVLVDEQGRYVDHRVLRSGHPDFRNSVEELLPQLYFTPAYHQGEAVQAWVNVPFWFLDAG